MKRNWKTSLFGIGALITGIATILKGDLQTGLSTIAAGIGLIFAKDYDISGN